MFGVNIRAQPFHVNCTLKITILSQHLLKSWSKTRLWFQSASSWRNVNCRKVVA